MPQDVKQKLINTTAEVRKLRAINKRVAEKIDRALDKATGRQLEIESML